MTLWRGAEINSVPIKEIRMSTIPGSKPGEK
jgi:hypothetical protein